MFQVKNEATRATVYIYGTIGEDWWSPEDENRAKDFAQTLDSLSPKPLDNRIDSAGGDVYEGFAIASAIQRYEGDTHAYVDGMAASAASYIALMADKVTMNDYAMLMIHNAWCYTAGNRDELRDTAERLEALDNTIAGIIASRSALSLDEVRDAMSAETWYTGEDALAAGMCDEVIETEQRLAACVDRAIAKRFRNMPEGMSVSDEAANTAAADALAAVRTTFMEISADRITMSAFHDLEKLNAITFADDVSDGDGEGASHTLSTLGDDEVKDAEGAILLGNRVYRKEN